MPTRKTQTKIIFTVISLAVTAGIFSYLFRYISIGQVVQIIKSVDRGALLMFVTLSLGMSFFRTWRYEILLGLSGYKPSKPALFLVVLVRNFFSDLLPARIGTLIYIFIVNTRLGVPLGPATSSFSLSFLFDVLAVVPLILLASFYAAFTAKAYMLPLFLGGLVIGGITIAIIHYLPALCSWIIRVLARIKKGDRQFGQKLADILSSVRIEVLKTKRAKLYTPVMVLSFLVRITKYAALYVFLYALLRAVGYSWSDLSVPVVFLGISTSEFVASLPVSGIASFGAYEGTWAIVFELLGFPGNIAKLTAVSHHLFTQVYGYLLGALALALLVLPVFHKRSDFSSKTFSAEPKPGFYRKIIVCSLGLIVILYGFSKVPPANSESSHDGKKADQPSAAEKISRKALMTNFPGNILFDSNRSGSFGIYTIRADGTKLKRIIDDSKWHEMFPDPSPEGKLIVFSRAKTTSRLAPSEIWIVEENGENLKRLNANGNFPTFSADGQTVYFERQRKKAMAVDLDGKNERELFPARNEAFKRYQVVKPRVSSSGRWVTFTSDRPRQWHAWYAEIETGNAFQIHSGCEPVAFKEGRKIAWIKSQGANERSGIFSFNLSGSSFATLEDAGAPRGHEYFPTLAANDRFLLYSVCRINEHSHENANYQIFIKDLATQERTRITFDAYTNRWPKLLLTKMRK